MTTKQDILEVCVFTALGIPLLTLVLVHQSITLYMLVALASAGYGFYQYSSTEPEELAELCGSADEGQVLLWAFVLMSIAWPLGIAASVFFLIKELSA